MSRPILSCIAILATLQACAPQPSQRLAYRYIPPAPPVTGYVPPAYTPPATRAAYVPPSAPAPLPAPTYQPEQRGGFTPGQALLATAVLLGGVCWMTDCLSPGVDDAGERRDRGGGGSSPMDDRHPSASGDGGSLFDSILPLGDGSGLYGDNPGAGVFRPRRDWD